MQDALEIVDHLLGIGADSLKWWQMSLRAIMVFIAALAIIRIGNHRIFGKNTAFDIILGIIYGSVLSRAITGNSPFWPTIFAAFTLVVLHKLLAIMAFHSSFGFGNMIKGKPKELVKDGEMQMEVMRSNSVTEDDIKEALRNSGHKPDISSIHRAYLERSGDISIICDD